ncbi:GH92 family glycosyl hydrolase [Mucilaginibacter daejeonensis]|uniref:GH92 family glycosyl hydrolase n=1 Tax=Mucilaginibacter daejeonensis TaxID=398049 RepID=UPI001D170938|nr:GH92 family glycosyl hydrolase [Mucilaginibacter daejeonensis]UEG55213.1 GH92 family glycosyl hydrolase [Mucilaginibacter daejeonensis]
MSIHLFKKVSSFSLSILLSASFISANAQKKKNLTPLVDPFIGTGGHGHTFPGATLPFGMVQLSPDTRLEGWDGCSGYHYSDTTVYGFSHTHLSGTGVPDYCDILFMPTTGVPRLNNSEYRSGFKKANEEASPGYYKTYLDKYHIKAELTATLRAGLHRYTFPYTDKANIVIDLKHRDKVLDSWIEVVNDHEIRGMRRSSSWAKDQYVYFYAKFSKPFSTYSIASDEIAQPGKQKLEGKNIKMYVQFNDPNEVLVKVGISSVSADGALKNLDADLNDFDFKQTVKQAKAAWNTELNKIIVEGGGPQSNQQPVNTNNGGYPYAQRSRPRAAPAVDHAKNKQTIFYTSLYHCMMAPNVYSDIDGQYRGLDGKVHNAQGFNYYTVFSLWDTFRAEHPLLTLIDKKRTLDFIKTFLAMYEQASTLPVWPLASNETWCMIGNHAIPVIADAYSKGIRDFDAGKVLEAMKASVNRDQFGLTAYRTNGLVLGDTESESVSKTLEYAYDDYCIAQMAKMMGRNEDHDTYSKRAQYWKNVFNEQNGFMQARVNGSWYTPFYPTEVNNNYTEGNAWHYSFFVPQDVEGLMNSLGGREKFEAKLDELFTTTDKLSGREQADITGLIGQYAHGNEPSHHMAYLYNFTANPEKTQMRLNEIFRTQYSAKPDGLAGNEDCGQMSAWYVMSALGLYNIAPGQQQFMIGLPQFDKATVTLENGKKFVVTNSGASVGLNNTYLQGMNLAKKPYNKLFIDYKDIADGGEFDVFTGRLPNQLFVQDLERPTSKISEQLIVPNPAFITTGRTFKQQINVAMNCADPQAKIYYTLDGSIPNASSNVYLRPLTFTGTTTVRAIAIKEGKTSFVNSGTFTLFNSNLKITQLSKYLPNYAASGDDALVDGAEGTANWRMGNYWQGFQGKDLEVVVDMGQVKPIKHISLGTLQDTGAWIVFPKQVEYQLSDDGKNFKTVATVATKVGIESLASQTQTFTASINGRARYIKVVAKQYGQLPAWHESKGNQSYIFVDELKVDQ